MAKRSRRSTFRGAYKAGFRAGVVGVLRGGSYRAAPVRLRRSVGSPATDAAARYRDVARVKIDVDRAERQLVDAADRRLVDQRS
jgi:hypothetical protein